MSKKPKARAPKIAIPVAMPGGLGRYVMDFRPTDRETKLMRDFYRLGYEMGQHLTCDPLLKKARKR